MSNVKKLMMTAASTGDSLNVEDVFSTYLYDGTSQGLAIKNSIAFEDGPTGAIGSSTKFENYNESFNKSSDLTGNSDGKTFTFSFWIYPTPENNNTMKIYHTSGSWKNTISWSPSGTIFVSFFNNESSGGTVFEIQNPDLVCPSNTWSHVIFSADMSDTTKRHLYINDSEATPSWSYSNQTIDWTRTNHAIGDDLTSSTGNFNGYMAHFFFDKTYRNLSVTSNRRYFIDDAKGSTSPSTQSALNPLIYLPMTSDYSVGQNLGSGGTFSATNSPTIVTDNGTEAEAGHGQGGMAWFKCRNVGMLHNVFDTVRGQTQRLATSSTSGQSAQAAGRYPVFTSTGFNLGNDGGGDINYSGREYCSWSFRKAPKFFDIVTYTGNATFGRTISHNLGVAPGMIWLKRLDSSDGWFVYHRSVYGTNGDKVLYLNENYGLSVDANAFGDAFPTATEFTLGAGNGNDNGANYVAYLFAHNDGDGEFGPTGDQDIIKCGGWSSSGSATVNLGFEPQWIMIKPTSTTANWAIYDVMRGQAVGGTAQELYPNLSNAEGSGGLFATVSPTPTGFSVTSGYNADHIYMAIRRGPMAVPESASEVFDVKTYTGSSNFTSFSDLGTNYVDATANYIRSGYGAGTLIWSRLTGEDALKTWSTAVEGDTTDTVQWDFTDNNLTITGGSTGSNGSTYVNYFWKRAPNFFDVVAYEGNSTSGRTVSHNLGVAPEMMWVKCRSNTENWNVYHKDIDVHSDNAPETDVIYLNRDNAASDAGINTWQNTAPTDSVFTVGQASHVNGSGRDYIAYLFASLDGVSKVGSYTGNGSTQNIDCGFTNGAQLIVIKRTDITQNWYVFDSERGIVAGNDPYLRFNQDAQEYSADYVDPYSAGFAVTGSNVGINANGGSYIFYAIAE